MSARDVLAATMLTELDTQARGEGRNDLYVGDEYGMNEIRIDGDLDLLALADSLIAAGWRAPEASPSVVVPIPSGAVSVTIQQKRNGEITARFGFWGDDQ